MSKAVVLDDERIYTARTHSDATPERVCHIYLITRYLRKIYSLCLRLSAGLLLLRVDIMLVGFDVVTGCRGGLRDH
jgi:hypothetical protein